MKTVENRNYFVENLAARVDNSLENVDNYLFSVDNPVDLGVFRYGVISSRRSTGAGERARNLVR